MIKDLDYGDGYRNDHQEPDAYAAGEKYFPDAMSEKIYYEPTSRGLEQKISEKLQYLRKLDREAKSKQKRDS